jgi:hypothetical protein
MHTADRAPQQCGRSGRSGCVTLCASWSPMRAAGWKLQMHGNTTQRCGRSGQVVLHCVLRLVQRELQCEQQARSCKHSRTQQSTTAMRQVRLVRLRHIVCFMIVHGGSCSCTRQNRAPQQCGRSGRFTLCSSQNLCNMNHHALTACLHLHLRHTSWYMPCQDSRECQQQRRHSANPCMTSTWPAKNSADCIYICVTPAAACRTAVDSRECRQQHCDRAAHHDLPQR